jgi:hypothetical protein
VSRLRRIVVATAIVIGLFVVYAVAHLALIELGREIVVLHKWTPEEATRPTRLWIVDNAATAWLHHGYPDSAWIARLKQDPVVTIERAGLTRRYRATPDPSSHDRVHQLLREKYGIADWWVRFVTGSREHCSALPVRLEPLED